MEQLLDFCEYVVERWEVETKEKLQELVSKVFNAGGYVDIVEDLHYSMYGKVPKFNQQLKGNVQIFNNEHHFER